MIFALIILVFLICLVIYDHFDFKKEMRKNEKILKKYDRNSETFNFLISEEGEKARDQVESLCNQLGIVLESDQEEGDEMLF